MSSRIISRITGAPWLIQSEALGTIIEVASRGVPDDTQLAAWKNEAAREALATRQGDRLGNSPTARVRDGVAIIPVAGPIFRYANLFTAFSGATALADMAENLNAATSDSRVRAILLELDSPGGEATGIDQAAEMIAAAARAKPIAAFVEGYAMSAAYWLASAAGEIVIAPTGMVGSLGAVFNIPDRTEAEARAGVRRYRIVSTQTPNKLFDPTTEAGTAKIQALADRLAGEFLAAAAANRGVTVEQLLTATDGGGSLMGADAVAARLADRVDSFEATLARLSAGDVALRPAPAPISRNAAAEPTDHNPGPAPRATSQENEMSNRAQTAAPAPAPEPPTAEQPQADNAAPRASLPADAPAPAPAPAAEAPAPAPAADAAATAPDPVAAERARCSAIHAAMQPGFAKLASLAVEGGWPVEQFTAAQAASADAVEAARREGAGASFRDSLPAPAGPAAPAATSGPDKWKAEFAASEDLQREFGTEGVYLAFKVAEAAGKVRPLKRA